MPIVGKARFHISNHPIALLIALDESQMIANLRAMFLVNVHNER
jgi:hypothetical protein